MNCAVQLLPKVITLIMESKNIENLIKIATTNTNKLVIMSAAERRLLDKYTNLAKYL